MKPTINDFLPFYIGCEVQTQFIPYTLEGSVCINKLTHGLIQNIIDGKLSIAKPILRPLESMTEEEKEDLNKVHRYRGFPGGPISLLIADNSEIFAWFCKNKFDIFHLHEKGLCLYKNEKGELY